MNKLNLKQFASHHIPRCWWWLWVKLNLSLFYLRVIYNATSLFLFYIILEVSV